MDFKEYQVKAKVTAGYPDQGDNVVYPTLGLCGESGEVADKIKKVIRDHKGIFTDDRKLGIQKELGDVLWYIAAIASELDLDLNTIAEINIQKLSSRNARGKLGGDGDNR